MFQNIIDLSIPIENNQHSDPAEMLPKIHYTNHQDSFSQMAQFFPGLRQEDLPDNEAWAVENITLSTHNGTHLDAPYHYATTMDKGKPALTIDHVPLEWCFRPGVKLDFRNFDDGYIVTAKDIEEELNRIKYEIQPVDIVIINTRAGKLYGTKDYLTAGCGMGREATLHLLQKGVKITGTDAWSWDAPFIHTKQRYVETKSPAIIWEGHKAGREIGFCHLEKLHNLENLPASHFYICCFPVKIKAASAGWTRAVALT